MHVRLMVIAATLAIGAVSAAAEPPKGQTPAAKPAKAPVEVMLASADNVRLAPPTADQPNAVPVKRRAARVTSCRCGDPQPAEQQQQ
jgi:hypothetical protein